MHAWPGLEVFVVCGVGCCFRGHRQQSQAVGGNASSLLLWGKNCLLNKCLPVEVKFILDFRPPMISVWKCSHNSLKALLLAHVLLSAWYPRTQGDRSPCLGTHSLSLLWGMHKSHHREADGEESFAEVSEFLPDWGFSYKDNRSE